MQEGAGFWQAFLLTLIAGAATGIGGLFAVFAGKGKNFLPASLGFSAGVMLYVSFVELFREAEQMLAAAHGANGPLLTVIGFFIGILLIALIDIAIPKDSNPHEYAQNKNPREHSRLHRVGILTAIALVVHNFPEGIATFASGMQDARLGVAICVAISIHNIPEGIAVAVPIYHATGSRSRALKLSCLSGLAEPAGALIGMLLLNRIMNDTLFGMLLAAVAGIMVFISLDELLPAAREYGKHHVAIIGLIAGMAVMAVTLLVL